MAGKIFAGTAEGQRRKPALNWWRWPAWISPSTATTWKELEEIAEAVGAGWCTNSRRRKRKGQRSKSKTRRNKHGLVREQDQAAACQKQTDGRSLVKPLWTGSPWRLKRLFRMSIVKIGGRPSATRARRRFPRSCRLLQKAQDSAHDGTRAATSHRPRTGHVTGVVAKFGSSISSRTPSWSPCC